MPLNENPFFGPVMQSIDMLAADNMRRQREERQEERIIAGEERQQEREDEEFQRDLQGQEMGDLTKFITEYAQNVKAGAEPDPDLLESVVEKRNALIQEGVYPQMVATAPKAPTPGKAEKPGQDMVALDPKTAAFYGYGADQPVKRETKRVLEQAYRNYFKPDKPTGADKDDPLKIISTMRKRTQTVIDKGRKEAEDTESVGIQQDIATEYLNELQAIEQDLRAGIISKAEARMKAVQLGSFDQFLALHGADRDQTTQEISELKEILKKAIED